MRKRQKEKFLLALRKTKTVSATRAKGYQRLNDLKATALCIRPGIEKHEQSLESPGNKKQQSCQCDQSRRGSKSQMQQASARDVDHYHEDHRQHQSGTK